MASYRLMFGYSSSPSYAEAVQLASVLSGYTGEGAGRAARHSVPISLRSLAVEERLLDLVRSWRNAALLVDGETLDRGALWAMFRLLRCYRARELSGLQELHCLGYPGYSVRSLPCRLMNGSLPWVLGSEYRDPALLPRLLVAHARRTLVEACPAYDHWALSRAVSAEVARGPVPDGKATAHEEEQRTRLERLLRDVNFDLEA
jgi:hypothetical protein